MTAIQLPTTVKRIIDGDTVEVEIQLRAHVRLLDCWAPERNCIDGKRATEALQELALHEPGTLHIPYVPGAGIGQLFSFERLLGRVVLNDGTDLSEAMVRAGHATREKAT
jgi:endonuclease YncB( thermonuclease family)